MARYHEALLERHDKARELTKQIKRLSSQLNLVLGASVDPQLIGKVVTEIVGGDYLNPLRKTEHVTARQAYTYLLKHYTNLTEEEMSGLMGGIEHSVIGHRLKKAKGYLETDPVFREKIERCMEKIELLM